MGQTGKQTDKTDSRSLRFVAATLDIVLLSLSYPLDTSPLFACINSLAVDRREDLHAGYVQVQGI